MSEQPTKTKLGVPQGHTYIGDAFVIWELADGTRDKCEVTTLEGALAEIKYRSDLHKGKLTWIQIDFNIL